MVFVIQGHDLILQAFVFVQIETCFTISFDIA